MKRFLSLFMAALLLSTIVISSAFAAEETVYAAANTWKTGIPYTKRTATGSFWKAQYKSGPVLAGSIDCYLYRKGGDRCTKIISLTKSNTPTTGLDYLAGQNVTGDYYKFNFRGSRSGNYTNYFNP